MDRNPLPQEWRIDIEQQAKIAAFTEDESYRLTGDLYARMQQCIRCYCLGEICDAHEPVVVVTGPFSPVPHWTEKAFRWSMTWLGLITVLALLMLIGGSDMSW